MGGQVVEYNPKLQSVRKEIIDDLLHTVCEIDEGSPLGDFHVSPRTVCIEEYEQVGGPVATILVVNTLGLSWSCLDRWSGFADKLNRCLVKTDNRVERIGLFGIEVENIFHSGNVLGVHFRDAPHLLLPRLDL